MLFRSWHGLECGPALLLARPDLPPGLPLTQLVVRPPLLCALPEHRCCPGSWESPTAVAWPAVPLLLLLPPPETAAAAAAAVAPPGCLSPSPVLLFERPVSDRPAACCTGRTAPPLAPRQLPRPPATTAPHWPWQRGSGHRHGGLPKLAAPLPTCLAASACSTQRASGGLMYPSLLQQHQTCQHPNGQDASVWQKMRVGWVRASNHRLGINGEPSSCMVGSWQLPT